MPPGSVTVFRIGCFKSRLQSEAFMTGHQMETRQSNQPASKENFAPDGDHDYQREGQESQSKKRRVPIKWILIVVVILLVAGYFGVRYWQYANTHESAEDAYTTNHIHQISPRINGTVLRVLVDDNVRVKAGQILVELDPQDYEVILRQAQANLNAAEAAVAQGEAQLQVAKANVGQAQGSLASAQATADNANADQSRNAELLKNHVISPQDMDHANQAARTSIALNWPRSSYRSSSSSSSWSKGRL